MNPSIEVKRRHGRRIATSVAALAVAGAVGMAVAAAGGEPAASHPPDDSAGHEGHSAEEHLQRQYASTGPDGQLTAAQRRTIREATARFRDVDVAVAAGYTPADQCLGIPDVGDMGFHYINLDLIVDRVIDPALPEILVYAPDRDGRLRLAAVEYSMDDLDQDLTTDDDRPTLFGEPFDGPMDGNSAGHGFDPTIPIHYDLHTWVWEDNPLGELAMGNPAVNCSHTD